MDIDQGSLPFGRRDRDAADLEGATFFDIAEESVAELDAVDSSGVVTQVLFQGTLSFDAYGPVAEISLGKEGQYLSNPALACK